MGSRSWSYFLWGLIVSLIFGSLIRVVFSPERMRAWVTSIAEERQPKFSLEFDRAKLTLAPALIPNLAIEFYGLNIAAKDSCETNAKLKMDRIIIPVAWDILWSRKLNFKSVSVDTMKILYLPQECSDKIALPALDEKLINKNELQKIEEYLSSRWDRDLINTLRFMKSLNIKSLQIYDQAESQFVMSFDDIEMNFQKKRKSAQVKFRWVPSRKLTGFKMSGFSRFNLEISSEGMKLEGSGNVLEGRFDMSANWDSLTGKIVSAFEVKDFPAPELFQLVTHWNLTPLPPMNLRNQWLRCKSKAYVDTKDPKDLKLNHKDCYMYGNYGKLIVPNLEAPRSLDELYPITIKLIDFKMSALNAEKHEQSLLFWKYSGVMNGIVYLKQKDQLVVKGEIEDMFLHFPLGAGKTWSQTFKSVDVLGQIANEKIMFSLTKMLTSKGQPIGEIRAVRSFSSEESLQDADVQLSWNLKSKEDLDLPETLKLFGSDLMGFSSKGKGVIEGSSWKELTTNIGIESFSLRGADIKNLRSRLVLDQNVGNLDLNIKSIDGSHSSLSVFSKMNRNLGSNQMEGLSLKLRFEEQGRWAIDPLTFSLNQKKYEFLGRGFGWSLDESLLQTEQGKDSYNVTGSILDPSFKKSL